MAHGNMAHGNMAHGRINALAWLVAIMMLAACGNAGGDAAARAETASRVAESAAELAEIKGYLTENGGAMARSTAALEQAAAEYARRVERMRSADPSADPYRALWQTEAEEVRAVVDEARRLWIEAHNHYELVEGIVAGVPSLSYYDAWIDAGPTGAEAPDQAVEWTLELPDGERRPQPGNIFHTLLETTLWGTVDRHTGLRVDMDGDGSITTGEALPEAGMFLATAAALQRATAEMNDAVEGWNPSVEDSFTALVTMIPTMGEYFEEWKASAAITGEDPRFVAQSRLVDIRGIATSLDLIYAKLAPAVAPEAPVLDQQIRSGFDDLLAFIEGVLEQERSGVAFGPQEADALGSEAQQQAQALAALVAQAADRLGLVLELG